MPDPGYGPNGERVDPTGRVVWQANSPPERVTTDRALRTISALGLRTIPYIDQSDDEAWLAVYLGGV